MAKNGSDGSTADSLRALGDDVRSLVRQELVDAQEELAGKARRAAKGAVLLGGAAVLAALTAGSSAVLLRRVLERVLAPTTSAFVATALYGGGTIALGVAGIAELRHALPLAPQETVDRLRQDTEALTNPDTGRRPDTSVRS